MDALLHQIGAYAGGFFALAQMQLDAGGLTLALALAVIGGATMRDWRALDATARDATLAYMLTLGVLTLMTDWDFGMPTPLSLGFWLKLMLVFVGYELAIAAVFFVKTRLVGRVSGQRRVR
ncbi:hypothetical protein [Brevundimonas nasdae]|uniref:hypothetical protein n=1 Tax=Brevundimonas nasdae TaxID=172043 RepID=UPI00289A923E|nr:hypothetical protein [Brevundimonas nasdae]